MATELQIAQGFQTLIQAMSEFDNADVTLNDETIYDGAAVNCPYIIIYTASEFEWTPAANRLVGTITIPIMHIEEFTTWGETHTALQATRQAIIDEIFTGAGMSANGLEGVQVSRISSLTPIESVTPDGEGEALPVYLQQYYGIEVELF